MLGNIRKLNQGGIQVVGNFKQEREREREEKARLNQFQM